MTTSAHMPDVVVEIAFNAGYSTARGARVWTDVSAYVELDAGIDITRGRGDEFAVTDRNRLDLTLDNSDGRFSPGNTSGAYYPDVKIGRPIRVTATINAVTYTRFLGYVDEWPVEWPGATNYAAARITATSRIARMGLDAELKSLITEEFISQAPFAYYPLGEASGAPQGLDEMGGPPLVSRSSTGTQAEFGGEMNLAGDSGTGVTFSALSNAFLNSQFTIAQGNTDGDLVVEAFVNGPMDINATYIGLVGDPELGGITIARLGVTAIGILRFTLYDANNVSLLTVSNSAAVDVTEPHHVAGVIDELGANTNITLYVDGVSVAANSVASLGPAVFDSFTAGFNANDTIAHITIGAPRSPLQIRADAGLTGFSGESASDRIKRYARYGRMSPVEVAADTDTSPVGAIDIAGTTVVGAMRKVEATESGVLFDAPDNTLTFKSRTARYNTTPTLAVDAAAQELEADVTPTFDRTALLNDVTANSPDGTVARVSDQTSIDEYGLARATLEIAGTTADAPFQAASWRVYLYAQPAVRIPALSIDLLTFDVATQATFMAAEIGATLTLSGLPPQAPASSLEFFVEGYSERIGPESYGFTFNVSPTTGHDVWTLEDATFGAYDEYPLAY